MNHLLSSMKESLQSVLPIVGFVFVLCISIADLHTGIFVLFIFGSLFLILGMSFFSIGSEIFMIMLGEEIGKLIGKSKKGLFAIMICFLLGVIITIAEPDLSVLAQQVPSIENKLLIYSVAIGVGVFLAISYIRIRFSIPLSKILILFYSIVLILGMIAPSEFLATAFDSGGVTTGPITVPFIMALGAGIAQVNKNKKVREDSFGLVSLCSIGPILSVLILSIIFDPKPETTIELLPLVHTSQEAFHRFVVEVPHFSKDVFWALVPMMIVLIIVQLYFKRFHLHQILKMIVGFIYTYLGLVFFLSGAHVGFMPAGRLIGSQIANSSSKYLLIPIGMIMGYFVVSAEPAVHSLKKQVVEITNGAISQKSIGLALSIGVAISLGLSMIRVLTGFPLLPILLVGYILSLSISFFVPPIYTGIAFDSGGVASGPMATTFILPFALGACEALNRNIMLDAFGIVSMIALTPLITIQVLGLSGSIKRSRKLKKAQEAFVQVEDDIVYFT
ncbi:MAG: DUF1538 domain-containing protein [Traorella sp.]